MLSKVEKNSAAQKAGLKRGDLIIKADGKNIKNATELKNIIGSYKPGQTIELEYERDKSIKTTTIKLDSNPDESNFSSSNSSSSNSQIEGLSLSELTKELKGQYRVDDDIVGVLITGVKEDSKAEEIGFKKGDIIIQVGKNEIKNIEDFNKNIKEYKGKKTLAWVLRNQMPLGLVIK